MGQRVIPLSAYPVQDEDSGIYPNSAAPSFIVTGLGNPGTYAQYVESPARWVLPDEMDSAELLPADAPVVVALRGAQQILS